MATPIPPPLRAVLHATALPPAQKATLSRTPLTPARLRTARSAATRWCPRGTVPSSITPPSVTVELIRSCGTWTSQASAPRTAWAISLSVFAPCSGTCTTMSSATSRTAGCKRRVSAPTPPPVDGPFTPRYEGGNAPAPYCRRTRAHRPHRHRQGATR